jgi:hypothetical protein
VPQWKWDNLSLHSRLNLRSRLNLDNRLDPGNLKPVSRRKLGKKRNLVDHPAKARLRLIKVSDASA